MNPSRPNPAHGPITISGVSNAAINAGGNARDVINVTQTRPADEARLLADLLAELKAAIPQLNLTPPAVTALDEEVQSIEKESVETSPGKDRIQRSLNCIYGILVGVAGNTAFTGLKALIESVKNLLN